MPSITVSGFVAAAVLMHKVSRSARQFCDQYARAREPNTRSALGPGRASARDGALAAAYALLPARRSEPGL